MVFKIVQMSIPVGAVSVDQSGKRSKNGELHVGLDPMNQRYASVGQIEQHPVLVGHLRRPDHTARVLVEAESLPVVDQSVQADPPRLIGCRVGKIGVCHHQLDGTVRPHPLEPWVLVAPHAVMTRGGEHPLELEGAPVVGCEDENVGDVIDETSPIGLRVAAIAVPNSPRKEVVPALMVEQSGVEDWPVAGYGTGSDQRQIAHPPRDRLHVGAVFVTVSALLCHFCHALYSSAGERAM